MMHDDRRQLRFADAGHDAVALAGGAAGMIGDPGGKSKEQGRRSFRDLACAEIVREPRRP